MNTPDGAPKTALDKAVAFLRRDIRSFLPGWKTAGAEQETAESAVRITLPSLVDFGNIDYLVFRREVLDWRDGFHARVTLEAAEMNNSFAWRVKWGLSDVGILRRIITNSASKKLQDHFIRMSGFQCSLPSSGSKANWLHL